MKNSFKLLSLLLSLSLLFSFSAFAASDDASSGSGGSSTESSGESEEVKAMIKVTESGTIIDTEGYRYEQTSGIISDEAMTDVIMSSDDYYMNFIAVEGGHYLIDHCTLSKTVSETPEAAGGVIAQVSDGLLAIRNSSITTAGKGGIRYDDYPVECSSSGTMVIVNSDITQTGISGDPDGYTVDIDDPPSNEALTISGYSRASMSLGTGDTYYYGSTVTTEGWAAMSTDMGSVRFYAYNSDAIAQHGGYGTYADTSCSNWFYGCTLSGAEIGAIISNNGAIRLYSASDAGDDMFVGLEKAGFSTADIELTDRNSTVIGGRNCIQLHAPEESKGATRNQIGIVEAYDTDFITSEELAADADLVDWYEDYGPALGEYIDLVKGAVFLVKSHVSDIHLTRCTAESYSDVLLMTAVNSDSMGVYALSSHDMTGKGTVLTLTDCNISGDIDAFDYQRSCSVTLENTIWSGAYITYNKTQWDSLWSEDCAADEKCYWLLDENTYNTGEQAYTSLTVKKDSTWNVTSSSNLDSLTVEDGGLVNGTIYVDGIKTDVSAGGTWTGNITVEPSESEITLPVFEFEGTQYLRLKDIETALNLR